MSSVKELFFWKIRTVMGRETKILRVW
jgi:hypothetical protein